MSEGYTKRYVSSGGFRNAADGPPNTPVDKATLNAMDEGIRLANLRDEAAGTPSLRTLGTSSVQAAAGNDRRLLYSKGLLSARPAASAAAYYFATDVNGGTLYASNGSTWDAIAPGVAQAGSGGTTVTGTADGQVPFYDLANTQWTIGKITSRQVDPSAGIPPSAIAGTAVIDSDPRLVGGGGGGGGFTTDLDELDNGTAKVRLTFPRKAINAYVTPTLGVPIYASFPVRAGDIFTKVGFYIDSTGASGWTGWFGGIYDAAFVKIRNFSDKGATVPTDEDFLEHTLTSVTPAAVADGIYYIALLIYGSGTPFKVAGRVLPHANLSKPGPDGGSAGSVRIAGHGAAGAVVFPTNMQQNDEAQVIWGSALLQ